MYDGYTHVWHSVSCATTVRNRLRTPARAGQQRVFLCLPTLYCSSAVLYVNYHIYRTSSIGNLSNSDNTGCSTTVDGIFSVLNQIIYCDLFFCICSSPVIFSVALISRQTLRVSGDQGVLLLVPTNSLHWTSTNHLRGDSHLLSHPVSLLISAVSVALHPTSELVKACMERILTAI